MKQDDLFNNIKTNNVPLSDFIDYNLKNLLRSLLCFNQSKRFSISEVAEYLFYLFNIFRNAPLIHGQLEKTNVLS